MQIVWDEPKRIANIEKHGLDFADLSPEFFEEAVILPARAPRHKAVSLLKGEIVTAVFSLLGSEAISIVSFRPAGRNERRAIR